MEPHNHTYPTAILVPAVQSGLQHFLAGTWTLKIPELVLRMVLLQKGEKDHRHLSEPSRRWTDQLKGEFSSGPLEGDRLIERRRIRVPDLATGVLQRDGSLAGSLTSNVGDICGQPSAQT